MKNTLIAAAAGVVVLALAAQPALAQQEAPTRGELEGVPPKEVARPSSVQVSSRGIEAGPCPLADSDVRTTISRIEFTGPDGSALDPALAALLMGIAPVEGEQSIRNVCDLRDQAQGRLRAARYVASVQIPQQRLDGGALRLEVVSGRIVEMRVRGNAGPYENLLKSRIEALKAVAPLNEAAAERILLLASDIPGLTVRLGLSPAGGQPGDLIGELEVSYIPLRLLANVQNYNSPQLGRETGLLHAEFYGLTGMGDLTSLTFQSTFDFKEQVIGQLRHSLVLDDSGTTLALRGTVARSRPDLDTLDLRTLSLIGGFEVAHPLLRSLNANASVAGGFEYALQRTRVHFAGSSSPLNRDRIASVYARLGGDTRKVRFDGSAITSLSGELELRKGLDILGATPSAKISRSGYGPSRFEGSSTATIVRGELEGLVSPAWWAELAVKARGQWANRPLLNFDEFAIGNQTIGRGYDPGANTGDRAIGFTVEPRINFDLRNFGRAQVFGYYDGVHLRNLDTGSTERKRYIESVGGGLRLSLTSGVRAEVTYTHPLDPPLLTGTQIMPPADRVLFSLTVQLVPFGF